MKVHKVCERCGSDNIWADAIATWDSENQAWELTSTMEYTHCENCDGECNVKDIPVSESEDVVISKHDLKLLLEYVDNYSVDVSSGVDEGIYEDIEPAEIADALSERLKKHL